VGARLHEHFAALRTWHIPASTAPAPQVVHAGNMPCPRVLSAAFARS
jgi:hypothetical protein